MPYSIIQNAANLATFFRILLIPVLITCFLYHKWYTMLFLFGIAALSDGVDGYLARYLKQTSSLGKWLDPVADKLVVVSLSVLLLTDPKFQHLGIPTIIIICREVIVSSLREWMAISGKNQLLSVSSLGKWKTATQLFALFLMILSKVIPNCLIVQKCAYVSFYLGAMLALISGGHYVLIVWKSMQGSTL